MQSAGSVLVVMAGLVVLYLIISGKMDAAVATWRAGTTGTAASPASSTASAVPGASPITGVVAGVAGATGASFPLVSAFGTMMGSGTAAP